jgi:hypothetical protein
MLAGGNSGWLDDFKIYRTVCGLTQLICMVLLKSIWISPVECSHHHSVEFWFNRACCYMILICKFISCCRKHNGIYMTIIMNILYLFWLVFFLPWQNWHLNQAFEHLARQVLIPLEPLGSSFFFVMGFLEIGSH